MATKDIEPPVTIRFIKPAKILLLEATDDTKFLVASDWERIEIIEEDE